MNSRRVKNLLKRIIMDTNFTGIRKTVFADRYAKDEQGTAIEQTPEMWRRVAGAVALMEKGRPQGMGRKFYDAMRDFVLVPGGRILSGAGTGYKVTFYNCFVIEPHDSRGGILATLGQMVEIMSRGGGVGINLSSLRPRGASAESERIFFRALQLGGIIFCRDERHHPTGWEPQGRAHANVVGLAS